MAQAMILRRGGSLLSVPAYTYTGTAVTVKDGRGWKIRFLTSGTLTFQRLTGAVDLFLTGGGGSGGNSYYGGAGGGGGGQTKTYRGIFLSIGANYPIHIGAGGAKHTNAGNGNDGESTTAFGNNAPGGKAGKSSQAGANDVYNGGGDGGSGGGGYANNTGGSDGSNGAGTYGGAGQGSTTREFGEPTGDQYSDGGNSVGSSAGQDGAANSGFGGGAGTVYSAGRSNGAGGSGIVVMRNHRA